MSECKHGLKGGCAYCHAAPTRTPRPPEPKRRGRSAKLSDKMNDRMTSLKRRLKDLRGG